jgi:hypothetical protein
LGVEREESIGIIKFLGRDDDCLGVVHSTLMRGDLPSDAVIGRAVDAVMAMVEAPLTR